MTAQILPFPTTRARPKPALVVPCSDRVVMLWAELNERIAANHANPCRHNRNAVAEANARYIAACLDEHNPL